MTAFALNQAAWSKCNGHTVMDWIKSKIDLGILPFTKHFIFCLHICEIRQKQRKAELRECHSGKSSDAINSN